MHVPASRAVVIISGLMTLVVLGGGALAVGLHNGWVRIASNEAVTADPQPSVANNESVPPVSAERPAVPAQPATQDEAGIYRQKLDEAYRALDDAYAQILALQSPQPLLASARNDDDRFTEHDGDDNRRGRRSDRRRSHDD